MDNGNKIAVLYGGFSSERKISISTGTGCNEALKRLGYQTILIDVTKNIPSLIKELKDFNPDVVFNALHGKYGEDGCIQGLLEMLGFAYTHSNVASSSIAMDKEKAKIVFQSQDIPTAKAVYGEIKELKDNFPAGKWILKPVQEGSSIGVFLVEKAEDIDIENWRFGRAMLEEYIPGREFAIGVMDDEVLGTVEILTNREFYNYDAKYSQGGSSHIKPDNLPADILKRMEDCALLAHKGLGCRGVTRSDFRYDEQTNRIAILELNSQPGMTPTSLIPDIGKLKGIDYDAIVKYIVEDAKCAMYPNM